MIFGLFFSCNPLWIYTLSESSCLSCQNSSPPLFSEQSLFSLPTLLEWQVLEFLDLLVIARNRANLPGSGSSEIKGTKKWVLPSMKKWKNRWYLLGLVYSESGLFKNFSTKNRISTRNAEICWQTSNPGACLVGNSTKKFQIFLKIFMKCWNSIVWLTFFLFQIKVIFF